MQVDAAGRIASIGPFAETPVEAQAAGPVGPSQAVIGEPGRARPGSRDRPSAVARSCPAWSTSTSTCPRCRMPGWASAPRSSTGSARYVFPLEHDFSEAVAEAVAPAVFRAFAAAGTTTALMYGAVYEPSIDAAFRAAEAHGIRAIIGKVMMDRLTYDETRRPSEVLELSLRQSADLCDRWHLRDDGRLRYAFTPRFAVSCTRRDAPRIGRPGDGQTGAYWQTHLAEDTGRDRRGRPGSSPRRATTSTSTTGPAASGPGRSWPTRSTSRSARSAGSPSRARTSPIARPRTCSWPRGSCPSAATSRRGSRVGLGSDVAGGPDLSLFGAMRVGGYVQNALRVATGDPRPILDPLGWLRLASLEGARALGLEDEIGSIEAGKEADLIAVDPALTAPPAAPPARPSSTIRPTC